MGVQHSEKQKKAIRKFEKAISNLEKYNGSSSLPYNSSIHVGYNLSDYEEAFVFFKAISHVIDGKEIIKIVEDVGKTTGDSYKQLYITRLGAFIKFLQVNGNFVVDVHALMNNEELWEIKQRYNEVCELAKAIENEVNEEI